MSSRLPSRLRQRRLRPSLDAAMNAVTDLSYRVAREPSRV